MTRHLKLLLAIAAAAGICTCVFAQTTIAVLPSVATLLSGDYSGTPYAYISLAGYANSGDGGGGLLFRQSTSCAVTTTTSSIAMNSSTITVASAANIIPGMSIYAYGVTGLLPAPDTVVAVAGSVITLAQPTSGSTSTTTTLVLGGNGGTVFMDTENSTTPSCFQRQNYTGDVRQFGAKCDVVFAASDGTATHGSTTFTSSAVTFVSGDVGKIIELNYAGGMAPFRTTIAPTSGLPGHTVTLAAASPKDFPSEASATDANMDLPPQGLDNPGSGWQPGDFAQDMSVSSGAKIQVTYTGVVAFAGITPGFGYMPGDILYGNGSGGTTVQRAPAQLQVLAVGGGGSIIAYNLLFSGQWKNSDPTTIAWTGGHGSAFGTGLLPSFGSFGVVDLMLAPMGRGSYSSVPTNPVAMTALGSSTGSNLSIDLAFSSADWSYGSDDTVALQNIENYAETYPTTMRGLAGAVHVPPGMCYASGVVMNRPVAWSGAGPRQSRLVQILGSPGNSVNSSTPGFFTLAVQYPPGDDYEQSGYGQPVLSFENLAFWGTSPKTVAYIGSNPLATNPSAGIVLANPVTDRGKSVPLYLSNVEVQRFPSYDLSANGWGGEIRGYQVSLYNSGSGQSNVAVTGSTAGNPVLTLSSTIGLLPGMSVTVTPEQTEVA